MKKLTILTGIIISFSLGVSAQHNTYRIKTDKPMQKVMHFGASDAWSMLFFEP